MYPYTGMLSDFAAKPSNSILHLYSYHMDCNAYGVLNIFVLVTEVREE